jgi:hypothetical protein
LIKSSQLSQNAHCKSKVQDLEEANASESSSNEVEEVTEQKQSEVNTEISKISEQATDHSSLLKNSFNEILKSKDQ